MPNNIRSMKVILAIALLPLLLLSVSAFGQGTSATLRGTVYDAQKAVLTDATITAVNVDTGVEATAKSNNVGVYNFPSLQPGTYNVVAEASGFQRAVMTDVRLRMGAQINMDFDMVVAGASTEVEVTGTVENMSLDAGSSTGTVLQEDMVTELPIIGGDVLDLVNVMAGVVKTEDPMFNAGGTTFAGVNASGINIQRDGISVNEIRYNSGIAAPSRMNTEMVGEFKMVLSPVDAEMGRGAGQIQMITKSGANAFHGSAVWNIQNTALDAREWEEKNQRQVNDAPWRNVNNYTLTASGPIFKNKTFFFVTWDQQISRARTSTTATVLTPCARKGIYRYLEGRGLAAADTTASISTRDIWDEKLEGRRRLFLPTRPNVDLDGSVLADYQWPTDNPMDYFSPKFTQNQPDGFVGDGIALSGAKDVGTRLIYQSVLGELTSDQRTALGGWNPDNRVPGTENMSAADAMQYAMPGSTVYTGACDDNAYTIAPGATVGSNQYVYDPWRNQYDPSGFVQRFTNMIPLPNDYTVGDGLNTAAYRWTRATSGADTVFGTMYDPNRKSITGKVDHNINSFHRLSGTYSYESNYGDDAGNQKAWPTGFGGATDRKPQTFTVMLTSTLRPTLLNEFRVGLSRTRTHSNSSLDNPKTGEELRKQLISLLGNDGSDGKSWNWTDAVLAGPGSGGFAFFPGSNGHFWGTAITSTWGGVDPRWTVSDTITWMKGAHSFKGGFEFRRNKSWQEQSGDAQFTAVNYTPAVRGGVSGALAAAYDGTRDKGPLSGLYGTAWQGFTEYDQDRGSGGLNGRYSSAYDLMNYMSGGIASISSFFFVTDPKNPRWNDPSTGDLMYVSDLRNREFSFFFKDDWRVNNSLTLNLGVRYEYYGVPWVDNGLAASVRNGIEGMYGVSNGLGTWMPDLNTLQDQGTLDYAQYGTEQIFVGPNSPNSDIGVFNKDTNNWAPHVGFAWQLPWFGRGKTTLRGGYSISYQAVSNFDNNFGYSAYLSHAPGMTNSYSYSGEAGCIPGQTSFDGRTDVCYMSFDNLNQLLPLDLNKTPRLPMGAEGRLITPDYAEGSLSIYDPNIRNPYVQSLNLSITRSIGNNLTLDVRYIGTLSRKTVSTLNLNTANYINNGLMKEFQNLRAGIGDPQSINDFPILNGYIPSAKYPGIDGKATASLYAPVDPDTLSVVTNLTGAEQLLYSQWSNFASGNFNAIASALQSANFDSRLVNLKDPTVNRPALNPTEGKQVMTTGGAPANLIYANPQYSAANIMRNQGRSNYHSMQVQLTMRPVRGLSFQTTYAWSRNLQRGSVLDWNDPNWTMDYGLSGSHRSHQLTSYGTYSLPLGANGFLFRNAAGAFKKAIEGWQISWIATATSGSPMSLPGTSTLWGTNKAVQVGPFDPKDVAVKWTEPSPERRATGSVPSGTYFNTPYTWVNDPQCGTSALVGGSVNNKYVSSNKDMVSACNSALKALAVVDHYEQGAFGQTAVAGPIIFQNAVPGEIGNVQSGFMTGPGRWNVDMTLAKSIEFMEGKRLEVRIDAQNIFNHAMPSYNMWAAFGLGTTMYGARQASISNPNVVLNDASYGMTPFGYLNSKAGHRTFQAKLRFSF